MKIKRTDRPVQKNISLRRSIVDKIDEELRDSFTKRLPFGAYSKLFESLVIRWLNGEIEVPIKKSLKTTPFCPECLKDITEDLLCIVEGCPLEKAKKEEIENDRSTDSPVPTGTDAST